MPNICQSFSIRYLASIRLRAGIVKILVLPPQYRIPSKSDILQWKISCKQRYFFRPFFFSRYHYKQIWLFLCIACQFWLWYSFINTKI